jgi:hypothetical protein
MEINGSLGALIIDQEGWPGYNNGKIDSKTDVAILEYEHAEIQVN